MVNGRKLNMKKILPLLTVGILILSGLGAVGISSNNTIVNTYENDAANTLDDLILYQYQSELEDEIISTDWGIVATFSIPEGASGLAYDGTYLYCGIYGANGDEVYQIDPDTGSYSLLFEGPQEDAFGLTYDGTYLWTTDHPGSSSTPAVAMQLNMSGSLISQFNLPDHYMSGIAYDTGDFWVATYYPEPATIYKVNATGSILQQFSAPDDQPWDLCLENENLWMADYWGDTLYKIDPTSGNLLENHSSEGVDPAGIVWDGVYLWYCDNGIDYNYDYLYKVALIPVVKGYVSYSDGSNIPNGVTVTITDLENGNSTTRTTQQASGGPGYYFVNVYDLDANNGDTILVNVSYGGCQGNNSVIINTSQGLNIYCNVTIYGNRPPAIPSQPSGPTFGYINTTYNYSTSTWDPDGDDIYYWFDWDDDSNGGWFGPYSSNETYTASHSWEESGDYGIKAKAKDEHGAELGVCWSDLLNVTIVISQPPNEPSDPDPEDGATDVDINADLSWNCSDPDGDDLTYDVYFEADDPTPDELVSNNQSGTTYDPGTMEYNTNYYWQIVAWDPYGFSTEGPVWDFTTGSEPNDPPNPPSDPSPGDGETDVSINTLLGWNCSDPDGDPLVYDVYLEKDDPTPDVLVSDDQTGTTYNPEGLESSSVYYWQIIAKDSHSAATSGPIWSFTTEEAIPDLNCGGSLSWADVPPGSTVTGYFYVENIGDPTSLLDWEIVERPTWGTWTITPEEGYDLTPELEPFVVEVSIVAPDKKNSEFTGEVKIVNSENSSDYCTVDASLATPRNKAFNFNFPLISWLLEQFPHALPILRYLLEL